MSNLEIVYMALKDIIPYDKNPRMNDDAVDKVAESIKEFGFKNPIILDKNNVIICGHTRYKASQKLKLKTVPCLIASDLSEKQVKAFRIADNKVSDYSIWDNKLLLAELDGLEDIFTGFDISDVFNDILDETDNLILDENEQGVIYNISFKSQDKNLIEEVKHFIEKQGGEISG